MKTVNFEIPTMKDLGAQLKVSNAIRKLDVFNIKTGIGKAEVTFKDTIKKVDIIIAIEKTGNIVKY